MGFVDGALFERGCDVSDQCDGCGGVDEVGEGWVNELSETDQPCCEA